MSYVLCNTSSFLNHLRVGLLSGGSVRGNILLKMAVSTLLLRYALFRISNAIHCNICEFQLKFFKLSVFCELLTHLKGAVDVFFNVSIQLLLRTFHLILRIINGYFYTCVLYTFI